MEKNKIIKPPDYLTVEEAAMAVRMPVSTLRQHIYAGKLTAFRPGRRVLIKRADLDAFVEQTRL